MEQEGEGSWACDSEFEVLASQPSLTLDSLLSFLGLCGATVDDGRPCGHIIDLVYPRQQGEVVERTGLTSFPLLESGLRDRQKEGALEVVLLAMSTYRLGIA